MSALLKLDSIQFGWKESEPIIELPSLEVCAGAHTFIMGPSGSGKSTLLNLIGGVLTPQKGTVTLNNIEVSALAASKRDQIRADSIGFIFQQFNLIPYLNALENVLLTCQFSQVRTKRAVQLHGSQQKAAETLLTGFFSERGFDFNRQVSKLSVGQQQRVAAARALIGSPELIIADEPTSALDYDTRHRFMSLLMKEADQCGSTLLFVSHDSTLANQFEVICDLTDINQVVSK